MVIVVDATAELSQRHNTHPENTNTGLEAIRIEPGNGHVVSQSLSNDSENSSNAGGTGHGSGDGSGHTGVPRVPHTLIEARDSDYIAERFPKYTERDARDIRLFLSATWAENPSPPSSREQSPVRGEMPKAESPAFSVSSSGSRSPSLISSPRVGRAISSRACVEEPTKGSDRAKRDVPSSMLDRLDTISESVPRRYPTRHAARVGESSPHGLSWSAASTSGSKYSDTLVSSVSMALRARRSKSKPSSDPSRNEQDRPTDTAPELSRLFSTSPLSSPGSSPISSRTSSPAPPNRTAVSSSKPPLRKTRKKVTKAREKDEASLPFPSEKAAHTTTRSRWKKMQQPFPDEGVPDPISASTLRATRSSTRKGNDDASKEPGQDASTRGRSSTVADLPLDQQFPSVKIASKKPKTKAALMIAKPAAIERPEAAEPTSRPKFRVIIPPLTQPDFMDCETRDRPIVVDSPLISSHETFIGQLDDVSPQLSGLRLMSEVPSSANAQAPRIPRGSSQKCKGDTVALGRPVKRRKLNEVQNRASASWSAVRPPRCLPTGSITLPEGCLPRVWCTSRSDLVSLFPELRIKTKRDQGLPMVSSGDTHMPVILFEGESFFGDAWGTWSSDGIRTIWSNGEDMDVKIVRDFMCPVEGLLVPPTINGPCVDAEKHGIPIELPPDIRSLQHAHRDEIPVSIIMSTASPIFPFILPPRYGYVALGLFEISAIQSHRLPLSSRSEWGAISGRVEWSFSMKWAPGGEQFVNEPRTTCPWWTPTPPLNLELDHSSAVSPQKSFVDIYESFLPPQAFASQAFSEKHCHLGWWCSKCGQLNAQIHFRHQDCVNCHACESASSSVETSKGYAWTLSSVREPAQCVESFGLPNDVVPSFVEPDVARWEDQMTMVEYPLTLGVAVKHVSTSNMDELQEEASELFHDIQIDVQLQRQTTPLTKHLFGICVDSWSDAPECLVRAREYMQYHALHYGKLSDYPPFNKLQVWAWNESGKRKGETFDTTKKPIVIMCLGSHIRLSLAHSKGYIGSDASVEDVTPLEGFDDLITLDAADTDAINSMEELRADGGPDSPREGAQPEPIMVEGAVENSTTTKAKSKLFETTFSLVHGDLLILQGDLFQSHLSRTGMGLLLVGSN